MRFACNSDFLKTHTFRTDSDFLTPNSRYYKIRPQTNKSNRIAESGNRVAQEFALCGIV
ncbi:hypothetical protein LEP1GSC163_2647 [Leptospira santarosai str. CBC379]|nr:hypothetical protein LEP1GSC163_2647 [Leptospira santarosai str. CBC379]